MHEYPPFGLLYAGSAIVTVIIMWFAGGREMDEEFFNGGAYSVSVTGLIVFAITIVLTWL